MANTGNLVVWFAGTGALLYMMNSQLNGPLEKKIAVSKAATATNNGFIQAGEGLQRRLKQIQGDNDAAKPVLEEFLKLFPSADIDTSKLTGILDGAPRELPNVNVVKAPPLRKDLLFWQPKTQAGEDVTGLYKTLVGDTGIKAIDGGPQVQGTLKLARMDQDWELESEWDSFPELLTKISQLSVYFEVTRMDVYGFVDPTMRKDYRPPKTGPKNIPKRIRATLVLTTVAMQPMPAAKP